MAFYIEKVGKKVHCALCGNKSVTLTGFCTICKAWGWVLTPGNDEYLWRKNLEIHSAEILQRSIEYIADGGLVYG